MTFAAKLAALAVPAAVVCMQPVMAEPAFTGNSPAAIALKPSDINAIAKGATVRIEGKASGSGILIKRVGDIYTGLTVAHLFTPQKESAVITSSGQSHTVSSTAVRLLPGLDLAVFQFTSSQTYPVAELGNSDQISETVYVAGYPLPTAALNKTSYNMTNGTVTAKAMRTLKNGYALLYSNATLPGMNGGPVLDSKGRLVAIHGLTDTLGPIQAQSINPQIYTNTGFNLGIPINAFSSRISKAGLNLNPVSTVPSSTPPTADDYYVRGSAFLQRGDYQQALSDYTQAIRLQPDFAEAYGNRQKIYFWQGNYQQAVADGNRAIQLNPDLSTAYIFRGFAHSKLGNIRNQLSDLNQAVARNPRSATAYSYRSYTHYLLSNYPQAIADTEQAVKLDAQSSWAYAVRGIAHSKQGQGQEALDDGSSAIQFDPSAVDGWFARAIISLNLKDYRSALDSINQAIKLNPNFADAYATRAEAHWLTGNRGEAIANIDKAIALDPNNTNIRRVRRSLGGP
jgi:tetratricopeptide (TPR) repeat protein